MDIDQTHTTASAQETASIGKTLGDWVRKGDSRIICLYGELGSGKTTFAGGFARAFGITSRLLSPTFIIVRRYGISKQSAFLYHVDLYRTTNEKDILDVGLTEILADSDSLVLIEWAEKMGRLLPRERIDVRFSVAENGEHSISICKRP